jgi:hypothetical protein
MYFYINAIHMGGVGVCIAYAAVFGVLILFSMGWPQGPWLLTKHMPQTIGLIPTYCHSKQNCRFVSNIENLQYNLRY